MPSDICAGYREKGATFCSNKTGVPMAELHRAVIDSLNVTFSDEKFEQYLRDQAADTEQIAARREPAGPDPQAGSRRGQAGQGHRRERRTTWTPW